VSNSIV